MNRWQRYLPLLALAGCSWIPGMGPAPEPPAPTLAELAPVELPASVEAMPTLGLKELGDVYRDVLAVASEPELQRKVRQRLAAIEMLDAEATAADAAVSEGASASGSYTGPIASYRQLLADYPDDPGGDESLYQLARAYELNGEPERSLATMALLVEQYPHSPHYPEAQFRLAENDFARGDYRAAEAGYSRVVAHPDQARHYSNALYMQGWSRFKLGFYDDAMQSFTATLDLLMRSDNNLDRMSRGEREMTADTLRVLAVMFSYLEGPQTIDRLLVQLGERSYQPLLYNSLGELYLKQERYRDSAGAYRAFIERAPESPYAHDFQLQVISAYEQGGFPAQVVAQKSRYVDDYGVTTTYWRFAGGRLQQAIAPNLKQYLDELARHYHAQAQAAKPDEAAPHYLAAADYYQRYIDSFPRDTAVPEMGFLLAEARFEAGDFASAADSYAWMAYTYPEHERAADAGYAAILARQALADNGAGDPQALVDSQLRFAEVFSADPRAAAVLAVAASSLLEQENYLGAITAANRLVGWQPYPGDDIVAPAWLVLGHSHFEVAHFQLAEDAYTGALATLPAQDPRRGDTRERLAASIYRQGEKLAGAGKHMAAAGQFERVIAVVPDSRVRRNAQYDAASSYLQAGDYAAANALLIDFRQRYPDDELSAAIGGTLVANYERMGDWSGAAGELDRIVASAAPEGERREAHYLAATYYDRAGDSATALERYRSYAHQWQQPVAVRMEAMLRLADMYSTTGELDKRQFWLRKLGSAHDGAGAEQDERTLYLAAAAGSELAQSRYQAFTAIPLSAPLQRSLKQKKAAMDSAVAAYQRVNDYGVQQFSTEATYRLGDIYHQLSSDLMDSERPAGLDALALEQYELLLEEQAYPFEEKAIEIHETNVRRAWSGVYDDWIDASFGALAALLPARYYKQEILLLARADGETGDPGLEEAWYRRQLELQPSDVSLLNDYGVFLRRQGRFDEAEVAYLQAISPEDPALPAEPLYNLAILYDLYMGRGEDALQYFASYQARLPQQSRQVAGWMAELERRL